MKYLIVLLFLPIFSFSQIQIGQNIDGEAVGDYFGNSISLSADGTIIAIGANQNDANGTNSGQVRIYKNVSENWIQIGDDLDGPTGNSFFGRSVSISDDGNIVAISGTALDVNGDRFVQLRIFENILGVWTQIGADINNIMEQSYSNSIVRLSGDGTVLAICMPYNGLIRSGIVRIFNNISGIWTQIGSDFTANTSSPFPFDTIFSADLSKDGNRLVIKYAGYDTVNNRDALYENQSGIWTFIRGFNYNLFSSSRSLSADGRIIAFGYKGDDENLGYVRIYQQQADTWTQMGNDIEGEIMGDETGWEVSLSSDGSIIAIGAPSTSENAENSGQVRIYKFQSGNWTEVGNGINGEAEEDYLGERISLSVDGSIVAVSSPYYSSHVRVFDLTEVLSTQEETLTSFKLYPNPTKNHVTIQLETGLILEIATIYNTLGQVVLIATETTINTSKLSSGTYVIEIKTNKGKSSKKLIIE
ncbi:MULTISPECIES: T9SS type A sorting domain-containing protein [Bizionia]|nr:MULTISPECIES: T9SS type A sorting domain-containing protein [Bizionia]OBX21574.1 hypothetical protein BAA08_12240 [Bizionia sp. APA-3]